VGLGVAEQQQYCLHLHIAPESLSLITLSDTGVIPLLEKLLDLHQIQSSAPIDFSQQFET